MRTWYVTQWLESNLINSDPICVKEIICHDMTQLCYFMFLQHCYNTGNTRNYYYIILKDHGQWGWDSADLWSRVVYGIAWAQLWQTRPCIPGVEDGNEQDGHRTNLLLLWCSIHGVTSDITAKQVMGGKNTNFCINMESKQSIWWWVGRTHGGPGCVWELHWYWPQSMLEMKSEWQGMKHTSERSGECLLHVSACSCASSDA